jgi:hypothetical protein
LAKCSNMLERMRNWLIPRRTEVLEDGGWWMVCSVSLLCVFFGASLAWTAAKVPARVVTLDRYGGALLVIGLALLGESLLLFR